jgi:hypothetical protein
MYVDNDFIWWISPRSLAIYFQLNFFLKSHQKPPCDDDFYLAAAARNKEVTNFTASSIVYRVDYQ